MKSASPALVALLNSGSDFQSADLWTLTLAGGVVVRWSGADIPIVANGNTFALGPAIERSSISEKVGLEVAALEVTLTADEDDRIDGVPLIPFIARHGFDGANVRLDRAFMADWGEPVVGTIVRFAGRVTAIGTIGGSSVDLTVSAWTVLFNVNIPSNLYQTGCLHTVYDAGCGLSAAAFSAASTVIGPTTSTSFGSGATSGAGALAQGRILFTSGVNAGLYRTVKSNDASGNIVLTQPLPNAPSAGDAFTAYQGCDLSQGTCLSKFNNLARFKGQPYVPAPETVA